MLFFTCDLLDTVGCVKTYLSFLINVIDLCPVSDETIILIILTPIRILFLLLTYIISQFALGGCYPYCFMHAIPPLHLYLYYLCVVVTVYRCYNPVIV